MAGGGAPDGTPSGGLPSPGGDRDLQNELRQRIADAEELRRMLEPNRDLSRQAGQTLDLMRKLNPNAFADPRQMAMLKNDIIDSLRQLEINLARKVGAWNPDGMSGIAGEADAPDRYRKMVEEYYRRLSSRSPEGRP